MPTVPTAVYDPQGICNDIDTSTRLAVGAGTEPTAYAATYTGQLGTYTLAAGDLIVAAGDTSGYKISLVNGKTGNNATATGTADWIAYDDGANLKLVTDGNGVTCNSGNEFQVGTYKLAEFRDPA